METLAYGPHRQQVMDLTVPAGPGPFPVALVLHGGRVRCAGAVGQAAVSDLERAAELGLGRGAVRRFCGGSPEQVPERYRLASPITRLPLGVPQLLVHGDRDDPVPAELSERYAAAARAAGDEATYVLRPGDDHMVHIDPASGAWAQVTSWLTRFER